jgi:hypothetical protein
MARENDAFEFVVRELHYGVRGKTTRRAVIEVRNDEVIVFQSVTWPNPIQRRRTCDEASSSRPRFANRPQQLDDLLRNRVRLGDKSMELFFAELALGTHQK